MSLGGHDRRSPWPTRRPELVRRLVLVDVTPGRRRREGQGHHRLRQRAGDASRASTSCSPAPSSSTRPAPSRRCGAASCTTPCSSTTAAGCGATAASRTAATRRRSASRSRLRPTLWDAVGARHGAAACSCGACARSRSSTTTTRPSSCAASPTARRRARRRGRPQRAGRRPARAGPPHRGLRLQAVRHGVRAPLWVVCRIASALGQNRASPLIAIVAAMSTYELADLLANADRRTLAAVVTHLSRRPRAVPDLRDRAQIEAAGASSCCPPFLRGETEADAAHRRGAAGGHGPGRRATPCPPAYRHARAGADRHRPGRRRRRRSTPPEGFHVVIIGAGVTGVLAGMHCSTSSASPTSPSSRRTPSRAARGGRTPTRAAGSTPRACCTRFTFDQDPGWPEHFSHQPELLAYVKRVGRQRAPRRPAALRHRGRRR